MTIDLAQLNTNGSIIIDEKLILDEDCYKNTAIKELKEINVNGKIFYNSSDEIELDIDVAGIMILEDSISLNPIEYPYSFHLNEIINESNEEIKDYYKNSKNTLDIMPILWQNIVLEVPISITKEENYNLSGDGWRLMNENEENIDPRLAELKKLLDEGKE